MIITVILASHGSPQKLIGWKQDDKIIANENDEYQMAGLKADIELMLAFGYEKDEILKAYPGQEEYVSTILTNSQGNK